MGNEKQVFRSFFEKCIFKGLPNVVNEHLHNWHKNVILNFIEEKDDLKILDAGCGYGRLSLPIIEKFPNVDITGIDISENYVRLYVENINKLAFVEAVETIPDEFGIFDYIICVTVLMYLYDEKMRKAVSNLLFHLKPDGKLILIEPHFSGILFQTGFGILFLINRIRKDTINTGGRSFRTKEIETLFENAGGKIFLKRRLPITSLFILPITLMGKLLPNGMVRGIYKIVSLLDAILGELKLPSIYVAYLITRD